MAICLFLLLNLALTGGVQVLPPALGCEVYPTIIAFPRGSLTAAWQRCVTENSPSISDTSCNNESSGYSKSFYRLLHVSFLFPTLPISIFHLNLRLVSASLHRFFLYWPELKAKMFNICSDYVSVWFVLLSQEVQVRRERIFCKTLASASLAPWATPGFLPLHSWLYTWRSFSGAVWSQFLE